MDGHFSSCYEEILQLAGNVGVSESVPRKTSMQRHRSNTPSESPSQHYKRVIAIPLLDSLVTELRERYSVEDCHAQHLLTLIPSVMSCSTREIQLQCLLFWERDLPFPNSLPGEVRRWQCLWHTKSQEGKTLPHNLLHSFRCCDAGTFPNIYHLLIACTLLITSAKAEWSFSMLRRIKTYARSTMSEERLSDLAVIALHYKEEISTDYLCHLFCKSHPRRLFGSSLFADIAL